MHKSNFRFCIPMAMVLAVLSCLTVPKNDSGKFYLITKATFFNDSGQDPFGEIILRTSNGTEIYEAIIPPENNIRFHSFIPPGYYDTWDIIFHYKDGKEQYRGTYKIPVIVSPDNLTIFPIKFDFKQTYPTTANASYIVINSGETDITKEDIDTMIESFSKDGNFATWKSVLVGSNVVVTDVQKYLAERSVSAD
jgi:hypothetical protein